MRFAYANRSGHECAMTLRVLFHRCWIAGMFAVFAGLPMTQVDAQERDGPVLIGVLTGSWGPTPNTAGLRDGLVELGYRENEDFVIGVQFTQGDHTAFGDAARDLVRNGADIIFTFTVVETQAARQAATEIPIVFSGMADPVRAGLVDSYARPGGNITGVAGLWGSMGGKRLQLLQQMVPGLQRVVFPYSVNGTEDAQTAKSYRKAAEILGIELEFKPLSSEEEARAFFARLRRDEVDGILSPGDVLLNIPGLTLEAASGQGIPAIFVAGFYADVGGLASYGPDFYSSGRQAARLVDKIIKGANPGEIPVEVNNDIEFVINLKVAKALGIEIPRDVLYQADRIIR